MKLGVNIDHIATLRQARLEKFPDPLEAAKIITAAGADGIVFHLREDRRHIQDHDVYALRREIPRLDFEMANSPEIIKIALEIKPELVTLVPEKREEITTEGGLDVISNFKQIKETVKLLQGNGIPVSLFIDPLNKQIEKSAETGAKFIEIHTGAYANARGEKKKPLELKKIAKAAKLAVRFKLRINAGHGLDYKNIASILKIPEIEELNIGFSIIARAMMVGLQTAVREMLEIIKKSSS